MYIRITMILPLAFIIGLVFPDDCFADTIHVPADQPTIQAGIDAAAAGDTVLVAPGTYFENIDFLGKAISLLSESGPEATFIDGKEADNAVLFQTQEGPDTLLSGFTITNGTSKQSGMGGGMLIVECSPTVTDCIFIANQGSGLELRESDFTITHCSFLDNSFAGISNWKGALTISHCIFRDTEYGCINYYGHMTMSHCIISDNREGIPSYDSQLTVTHCIFTRNDGGGMECWNGSATVSDSAFYDNDGWGGFGGGLDLIVDEGAVTRCIFAGNEANLGGGVYIHSGEVNVTYCTFTNNRAFDGGGIMGVAKLSHCTFIENSADAGGAIFGCDRVEHCTIYNNSATIVGGIYGSGIVINCIVWDNEDFEISPNNYVTYSCVKGGFPGTGNIDADPLFIDALNKDLHLTYSSPCKDAGLNTYVTEQIDFEGDPRIAYGTVDMGADEFHPHLYYTGDATPGEWIDLKIIGMPLQPALLYLGSEILSNPRQTKYGLWHLMPPCTTFPLGQEPWSGYIKIHQRIPLDFPASMDLPMQALVRKLTNVEVLEIR